MDPDWGSQQEARHGQCPWRGRQRHIFINILSPRAGQSRPTARGLWGRRGEAVVSCRRGGGAEEKSGHGVTPGCSLWQELGPPHKPGATAGAKKCGVRQEERAGKMGPCPQVAVWGREVEGGQRGGDSVCGVTWWGQPGSHCVVVEEAAVLRGGGCLWIHRYSSGASRC